MALSFAELKKNSTTSLKNIQEKIDKEGKKEYKRDIRYWKPSPDDAGNSVSVIRFLPEPEGEELPYVSYYDHSFDVAKRYYIEKSLTSLGQPDPLGEANAELWQTGLEENKEIARKRKRRLHYISNILVIKDPKKPENEGKVFLFEYGTKIYGKLKDKLQPEGDIEDPVFIFDMFEGENFKLKQKKQGEFFNYDDSSFMGKSVVADGDEAKMEEIWNAQYSLAAEVAPDKFKSYDDLKKKLEWVLNGTNSTKSAEDKVKEKVDNKKSTTTSKKEDETPPFDIDDEPKSKDSDEFSLDLDDFSLEND